MVTIYRFPAVRPAPGEAQAIAAVPYDVVTADEARAIIKANPDSFLTVAGPTQNSRTSPQTMTKSTSGPGTISVRSSQAAG